MDAAPTSQPPRLAWAAWAAVCLIWGTTYLAIKVSLETIPPFLLGGLRYVTAGLMLAVILRLRGGRLAPREHWGRLAATGFFLILFGNGGVVWGEQFVSSGLTAVVVATSPFWMVGVDAMLPGAARLTWRQWLGLGAGFTGVAVIFGPDVAGNPAGGRVIVGVAALQVACAGWAVGTALTRRGPIQTNVLGAAAVQMVCGGLFMLAAGTLAGEWGRLSLTPKTGVALAYLTLAGSLVAFAAYVYTLRHLDLSVVSLYTYINPVIAVVLGIAVLGEPFHWWMVAGGAIIAGGVAAVGPVRRRPRGPDRRAA